jgi:hypothetical protein
MTHVIAAFFNEELRGLRADAGHGHPFVTFGKKGGDIAGQTGRFGLVVFYEKSVIDKFIGSLCGEIYILSGVFIGILDPVDRDYIIVFSFIH